MAAKVNRQVVLKARPTAIPEAEHFEIVASPVPEPGDGQFLVKNLYLSVDPAMRGWVSAVANYSKPVGIGEVMRSRDVGEVMASRHPDYRVGDKVVGWLGWQEYALSDGKGIIRRVDEQDVPLSAALGVLGMNGVTAYFGLLDVGQPKPGETVVVSTAAGAVGSAVGQIAKLKGCRTVGIAGGPEKVRLCREEFGYDAAIDYKATPDLDAALAASCPKGIDVYFENVGGPLLDAVLMRCNPFARIPLCGMVSQYNATDDRYGVKNLTMAVGMRIKLQGFIVSDRMERWPEALKELGQGVRDGKIKYRETVTEGLENAPRAFIGLLKGENFGKQLVKLA